MSIIFDRHTDCLILMFFLLQLDASHLRAIGNSVGVRKWYNEPSLVIQNRIAVTGFTPFILSLSARAKKHD